MSISIKGTVVSRQPIVTGEGKNGVWKKREFIIEYGGEYPKKVAMQAWGDLCDKVEQLTRNQEIEVFFSPESREYNNKWYTDNRCYKIVTSANIPVQPAPVAAKVEEENDDLPF